MDIKNRIDRDMVEKLTEQQREVMEKPAGEPFTEEDKAEIALFIVEIMSVAKDSLIEAVRISKIAVGLIEGCEIEVPNSKEEVDTRVKATLYLLASLSDQLIGFAMEVDKEREDVFARCENMDNESFKEEADKIIRNKRKKTLHVKTPPGTTIQ